MLEWLAGFARGGEGGASIGVVTEKGGGGVRLLEPAASSRRKKGIPELAMEAFLWWCRHMGGLEA